MSISGYTVVRLLLAPGPGSEKEKACPAREEPGEKAWSLQKPVCPPVPSLLQVGPESQERWILDL